MADTFPWKAVRWLWVAMGIFLLLGHAPAGAAEARQYKLEAAFLYNFFNYIAWPGNDSAESLKQATICVERQDPVQNPLAYVQQKMATQRSIEIREWHSGNSAAGCQLLFVRSNAKLPADAAVLTVTSGSSVRADSMVALEQKEDRIAIHINNSLLGERGFQASSRLLALAQEVN